VKLWHFKKFTFFRRHDFLEIGSSSLTRFNIYIVLLQIQVYSTELFGLVVWFNQWSSNSIGPISSHVRWLVRFLKHCSLTSYLHWKPGAWNKRTSSFDFCSLKPVNRKGNTVAHNLAQLALSSEPNKVWLEDTPPQIASLVISYSFY
jgi:hypothetical protein